MSPRCKAARTAAPPAQTIQRKSRLARRLRRFSKWYEKAPWLLPLTSFIAGWIGFVMVRRGADWARLVATLALLGWLWLLIEPIVRRLLDQRRRRLGTFVVNLVSQSLQQELLFFSLPFVIGATQSDLGQIAFAAFVGVAALVSTIDPLYERWIAKRAARRLLFHAYCSWIAALVVLPMVLLLPLEQALPLSLGTVVVWLVLTFPLSWRSLRTLAFADRMARERDRGADRRLGAAGAGARGRARGDARANHAVARGLGPGAGRLHDAALGPRRRRGRVRGDPCPGRAHANGDLRVASQR